MSKGSDNKPSGPKHKPQKTLKHQEGGACLSAKVSTQAPKGDIAAARERRQDELAAQACNERRVARRVLSRQLHALGRLTSRGLATSMQCCGGLRRGCGVFRGLYGQGCRAAAPRRKLQGSGCRWCSVP